jgi:regulator of sigma E protease
MELVIDILSSAFWIILAITILVFVHEMGHFLTAKWFGMRVERFSVGFPPKLFGRKYGDTEYVVGATPLGGYVKISGMIDESFDTEHLRSEPEPWEFRAKPVWQRTVVITAGVIFNVILAAIIFSGLKFSYGETYIPAENIGGVYVPDSSVVYNMGMRTGDRIVAVNGQELERLGELTDINTLLADTLRITVERDGERLTFTGPPDIMTQMNRSGGIGITRESFIPPLIGGVSEDFPAGQVGLRPGDRIVSIEGDTIRVWEEMTRYITEAQGEPITVRWLRPDSARTDSLSRAAWADSLAGTPTELVRQTPRGLVFQATITPEQDPESGNYVIGVLSPSSQMLEREFGFRRQTYGLGEAIVAGVSDTWSNTKGIVVSLQRIFVGRENLRENLGGPVMVAQVTQEAAEAGAFYFWRIVAILSITLAIMNILPIPALDGGQLVFLIYEGITRRKPSTRVRMAAQQIGMILIIGFMAFLIFNDILRL